MIDASAVSQSWVPLKLQSGLANTVEQIDGNIRSALQRSYIPLNELLGRESGAVAIVGSGPSLKRTWKTLKHFKGDIIACNAACQFLLGKGITPKYFFCFDADELMLEFITPHPRIMYLLSSRCPPKAFDMLEGCKVVCWHANGDEHIEALLQEAGKMEPMIAGGTAAVTRSMLLARAIGYGVLHLFGADSSHEGDDTHIRQSTTVEKRISVRVNKRDFSCSPWMAQQAEDFKMLAPALMQIYGVRIHVHGDGLIPHIASALGCRTELLPKFTQVKREWAWKAKTLWQHI